MSIPVFTQQAQYHVFMLIQGETGIGENPGVSGCQLVLYKSTIYYKFY